jgi:cation transport regulator ChaC
VVRGLALGSLDQHETAGEPPVKKKNVRMGQTTSWYFAYGSNMNRAQMLIRAGQIFEEHEARLENYEMLFNKKARGGTGEANVHPASGKTVHGVLYKIPEVAFRSMDRFEGAPVHYRRIEVAVTEGAGRKVNAQVYIATKIEKGLRPAPHYLQKIIEGAKEHGLPENYIEQIEETARG